MNENNETPAVGVKFNSTDFMPLTCPEADQALEHCKTCIKSVFDHFDPGMVYQDEADRIGEYLQEFHGWNKSLRTQLRHGLDAACERLNEQTAQNIALRALVGELAEALEKCVKSLDEATAPYPDVRIVSKEAKTLIVKAKEAGL